MDDFGYVLFTKGDQLLLDSSNKEYFWLINPSVLK